MYFYHFSKQKIPDKLCDPKLSKWNCATSYNRTAKSRLNVVWFVLCWLYDAKLSLFSLVIFFVHAYIFDGVWCVFWPTENFYFRNRRQRIAQKYLYSVGCHGCFTCFNVYSSVEKKNSKQNSEVFLVSVIKQKQLITSLFIRINCLIEWIYYIWSKERWPLFGLDHN